MPSLYTQLADIGETRGDLEQTDLRILDPNTYTAFLSTPYGRFNVFIPQQNVVFSFVQARGFSHKVVRFQHRLTRFISPLKYRERAKQKRVNGA